MEGIMFAEERKIKIAKMISDGKSVRVSELAKLFKVSESTIRRDLMSMENHGNILRTHGGAVSNVNTQFEPSFFEKQEKHADKKDTIGKIAAGMINDGDTVIIDSGTTTQYIGKYIKAKNITIITNSVPLSYELSNSEDIEVITTGGMIRSNTKAMIGPTAEMTLKQFRVDKAFIGANGISIECGATTPNIIEANTKKAMIETSKKVYIVADSSKFNEVTFAFICSVKDIDCIITDSELSEEEADKYRQLGVDIITRL
jgi:DeoR family fructose operon transcriptional repressor